MGATLAKGTSILIGDAASPEEFTAITGQTGLTVPDPMKDMIETTDNDSTTASRTYAAGLEEPGEVGFLIKYDPGNTQHALLATAKGDGLPRNFQTSVPVSPAEVASFAAIVHGFETVTEIDGYIGKQVTLKLTGAVS